MIHFNTTSYMTNLDEKTDPKYSFSKSLSFGGWSGWQQAFRSELRKLTGLEQISRSSSGLALEPKLEHTQEHEGYTIEKRTIQTEPGVEQPFYLLLPRHGKGPFPLVLTPHGHHRRGKEIYVGNYESDEEKEEALEGDRDIALQAVAAGFAVIAMDVRGFWEMSRLEEYEKRQLSCTELQKRAYLYGRTIIGERVHDMGRLIDYAATRPEIDSSRIAITGNSGGGAVSLFAAALDERINVSVPGSFFCTFRASLLSVPHCLCNYIPGIMHYGEMYDVAGLIAPRPLLIINGETDPLFPIDAAREAYQQVEAIYRAAGHAERCQLYVGNGGHRYYKQPVWDFVSHYLNTAGE